CQHADSSSGCFDTGSAFQFSLCGNTGRPATVTAGTVNQALEAIGRRPCQLPFPSTGADGVSPLSLMVSLSVQFWLWIGKVEG
ncbi:hypothetical protein CMK14_05905, partial [Candidatus Poribacteria bacterium]|nr:hypothetical protein [Candidatus Poribacteria bacterium]